MEEFYWLFYGRGYNSVNVKCLCTIHSRAQSTSNNGFTENFYSSQGMLSCRHLHILHEQIILDCPTSHIYGLKLMANSFVWEHQCNRCANQDASNKSESYNQPHHRNNNTESKIDGIFLLFFFLLFLFVTMAVWWLRNLTTKFIWFKDPFLSKLTKERMILKRSHNKECEISSTKLE